MLIGAQGEDESRAEHEMAKALWNGKVIAQSGKFEQVEGDVYFPPASVNFEYLEETDHHTVSDWFGEASYYDVVVDGERQKNAAWCYPEPEPTAQNVRGHIAFGEGVVVEP
jgi:uncharacterized protein (DUF427 family)